jgi:hypothetical protein
MPDIIFPVIVTVVKKTSGSKSAISIQKRLFYVLFSSMIGPKTGLSG